MAPLLVELGETAAYDRHRQAAFKQFENSNGPAAAERIARFTLLLPAPQAELASAIKLAETAAAAQYADNGLAWRQFTQGLAEYRQGHFAGAIDWMSQAVKTNDRRDLPGWNHEREANRGAAACFVQAMARQKLGQRVQAQTALARGMDYAFAWSSQASRTVFMGSRGDYGCVAGIRPFRRHNQHI